MQQLVLTIIPMDLSNFIIYMPKLGLHASSSSSYRIMWKYVRFISAFNCEMLENACLND